MHLDNRLSTVTAWPIGYDEATALRAFVQICDMLADERGDTQRGNLLRELVRTRDLLTLPQHRILLDAAMSAAATARLHRFFRMSASPHTLSFGGPLATSSHDHIKAIAAPATPPPVARPAPSQTEQAKTYSSRLGGHQIGELIKRIERFQDTKSDHSQSSAPNVFEWRSDPGGLIVEAGDRFRPGPPLRLTEIVYDRREDILHALSRNTAFANKRGCVEGAGYFLMSGRPLFDPVNGMFRGYRGRAERESGVGTFGMAAATVADIAHEVRTPLNAIYGYAEMIERQVLGPAPDICRADALAIMTDADRLLAAVDALGDAAAMEEGRVAVPEIGVDPQALADQLSDIFAPLANARGIGVEFSVAPGAVWLAVDPQSLFRALSRLLTAMVAFACSEDITVALENCAISISRPDALREKSEKMLLSDVLEAPNKNEAPLLGLAFTLRLVRRFAEANGGTFEIDRDDFRLSLPSAKSRHEVKAS